MVSHIKFCVLPRVYFCVVCCMVMNWHTGSRLLVCDVVLLHKHKQFQTFHRILVSSPSGPSIQFEVPDRYMLKCWGCLCLCSSTASFVFVQQHSITCVCAAAQHHLCLCSSTASLVFVQQHSITCVCAAAQHHLYLCSSTASCTRSLESSQGPL